MDGIIIDTRGESDLLNKDRLYYSGDEDDIDFDDDVPFNPTKIKKIYNEKPAKKKKINPTRDFDLEEFEADMGWTKKKKKKNKPPLEKDVKKIMEELDPVKEAMKKSHLKRGVEKLKIVPSLDVNDKRRKLNRRRKRAKTKGKEWFNMRAPEMTPEIKNDLEIIRMRAALDPKRFYKKNDMQTIPKYFQIGKVLDSPLDFYNDRITNKERKKTIVDELMADAEFSKYNKRKYKEIIDEKRKHQYKAQQHAKKLKRKKK